MKSRKFYGSVSRHANATLIFQHIKLQSSLPSQKVVFSNSLTDVLSTSETQEQVLRRVEVPVQNDCVSKWAPGQIQQLFFNPWHLLGPIHQLSFPAAAQLPCICLAQSPFKEVLFFLATFLHSWCRNQLLSLLSSNFQSCQSHSSPNTRDKNHQRWFSGYIVVCLWIHRFKVWLFLRHFFFFCRIYSRQAMKALLITCEYLLYSKAWSAFTISRNVYICT